MFQSKQPDQRMAPEMDLKEQILRSLPKTQITMNTSVGDLIEVNQLLVKYFMEKEFAAPKKNEISV